MFKIWRLAEIAQNHASELPREKLCRLHRFSSKSEPCRAGFGRTRNSLNTHLLNTHLPPTESAGEKWVFRTWGVSEFTFSAKFDFSTISKKIQKFPKLYRNFRIFQNIWEVSEISETLQKIQNCPKHLRIFRNFRNFTEFSQIFKIFEINKL